MSTQAGDTAPLVKIDRLAVTFYTPRGTVRAIREASLDIWRGELLGLPLGLGVVDPLPRPEVEARPDVKQVVPDGVRLIPPEPGARQTGLHPYRAVDDHLFDASRERERHHVQVELVYDPP